MEEEREECQRKEETGGMERRPAGKGGQADGRLVVLPAAETP